MALRAALQIGKLGSIEPSYNNFLLQAKLIKNVNEPMQALAALKKAISSGKKNGEVTKEAEELLQDSAK